MSMRGVYYWLIVTESAMASKAFGLGWVNVVCYMEFVLDSMAIRLDDVLIFI
jgi:hypothetical protein